MKNRKRKGGREENLLGLYKEVLVDGGSKHGKSMLGRKKF